MNKWQGEELNYLTSVERERLEKQRSNTNYSLSQPNTEKTTHGMYNVYGSDIALEKPVQEEHIQEQKKPTPYVRPIQSREQVIRRQIEEYEEIYERRKGLLVLKTFLVVTIVLYIASFAFGWVQEPIDMLRNFILSIVGAGALMFVGTLILMPLTNLRETELRHITRLKVELEMIEKGQL